MPKKQIGGEGQPERGVMYGRIEVKAAAASDGADAGTFTAYASLFDEPHGTSAYWLGPDYMDIVKPGAFDRSLAEHKKRGTMPALLWQHDMDRPLGAWISVAPDKKGLLVEGRLAIKTQFGADTWELMKVGAIPATSIGFLPVEYEIDEKAKTRSLIDVDLLEISPVSIPGDPGALISDVKAKGKMSAKQMQSFKDGVSEIKEHAQSMQEGCDKCDHKATIQMADDLLAQLGDSEDEKSRRLDPHNIRDLEAVLREAGLSRSEAKGVLASGFKSLSPRDADELAATFAKFRKTLKGA